MPRDRHLTRMVAALCRRDPGAVGRIAALSGVDRSTVSHWLSDDGERRYSVPLDALPAIIDALDNTDILRAIGDEVGVEVGVEVGPKTRPTASPVHLEVGVWDLLGHASTIGASVRHAVEDGVVTPAESDKLRVQLSALRDLVEGMMARLPRSA